MSEIETDDDALGVQARARTVLGRIPARSLVVRVGFAMAAISLLALASMLAAIIIAETATGDATAINRAGSLRMHAYRMAEGVRADVGQAELVQRAEHFEATLSDPALTRVIPDDGTPPSAEAFAAIRHRWIESLRPALLAGTVEGHERFVEAIPGYVERIDALVSRLESAAEERIQLLRFGQGVGLFVTVVLVFFTMYRILIDVLPPLRDLLGAANAIRGGDLTARTSYRADDELGLLSRTFNRMAESLQAMYGSLEARVREKTTRLEESNRALQLLYDAAHELATLDNPESVIPTVLAELESTLGFSAAQLCRPAPSGTGFVTTQSDGGTTPLSADAPAARLLADRPTRRCSLADGSRALPLLEGNHHHGLLVIRAPGGAAPSEDQLRLCTTVAGHIAAALERRERATQQHRLALMEERAVIARELHDSLAQALSYLKIQTSRLGAELRDDGGPDTAARILDEIRNGLNSAYRQLRELLNTFRLQLSEGGMEDALRAAVTEFADRGGLPIDLDVQVDAGALTANEELHVVQIAREALANVVQHAGASHARVGVTAADDGITVTVADDGVGLPPQLPRDRHYGLTIMSERARSLGGRLEFHGPTGEGTIVRLTFRPGHAAPAAANGAD